VIIQTTPLTEAENKLV